MVNGSGLIGRGVASRADLEPRAALSHSSVLHGVHALETQPPRAVSAAGRFLKGIHTGPGDSPGRASVWAAVPESPEVSVSDVSPPPTARLCLPGHHSQASVSLDAPLKEEGAV